MDFCGKDDHKEDNDDDDEDERATTEKKRISNMIHFARQPKCNR